MATKNDPGPYDCYAKLEPDEPHFVIRGKDPIGGYLVNIWRYIRAGNHTDACLHVYYALKTLEDSSKPLLPLSSDKSLEAENCAIQMMAWSENLRKAQAKQE